MKDDDEDFLSCIVQDFLLVRALHFMEIMNLNSLNNRKFREVVDWYKEKVETTEACL
jgi:hypothetical protein